MTVFMNGFMVLNVRKVEFDQEDCNVAVSVILTFYDGTIEQEQVDNISDVVIEE